LIFSTLRQSLAQDELEAVQYWRQKLPPSLHELAEDMIQTAGDLDVSRPRVLEEILANYYRLRKRSLDGELNNLRFQLESLQASAEEGGDDPRQEMWQLTRRVQALADQRERLDRALARGPGAVQTLVGT
jgi:hypothetical protein